MKKQRIAVIGPNPIQSNPWMDPIHVQLWDRMGRKLRLAMTGDISRTDVSSACSWSCRVLTKKTRKTQVRLTSYFGCRQMWFQCKMSAQYTSACFACLKKINIRF